MYYLGFLSYFGLFVAGFLSSNPRANYFLNKPLVFAYLFLFFVVVAYRPYDAGSDTESYLNIYSLVRNGYDLPTMEVGFQYLLSGLAFLNVGEREFWILLTLFFMASFIFAAQKFNFNQKTIIYLGLASSTTFLDLGTNGIRQGLAAGVGLISLFGVRGLKRVLLIFLAVLIHSSAAIFLACFISTRIEFLLKDSVLRVVSLGLGFFLFWFLIGFNLISVKNFSFLPIDFIFAEKFISYTDIDAKSRYESMTMIGRLVQCVPLAVLALFACKIPKSVEFKQVYFAVLVFAFVYLSLASIGYSYRWAYYSYLAIIYMLPWYICSGIFGVAAVQKLNIALCCVYLVWGTYSVWFNGVFLWN